MKRFFLVILLVLVAAPALAADLVCTLPTESVTRGVELCEEARLALRVRTADWNNNACASYFLRLGLIEAEKISTRRSFTNSVNTAVRDAVASLTTTWPAPTAATCGDTIIDTEFGETCDDGNRINGDGCDSSCIIEP